MWPLPPRTKAACANERPPRASVRRTSAAAADLGLPLFCKPADGQSSRGVSRLDRADVATVIEAFRRAKEASPLGETTFEQYISGTEATVEGIVVDGQPTTLAISDKAHY